MADIFISYSKADRDKVVMLGAYLSGDAYRDEIIKQLTAARTLIVMWTQPSIKSDRRDSAWVSPARSHHNAVTKLA